MACDISMTEGPAPSQGAYIPRSVIDHMNPFFFQSHGHAHAHNHNHYRHHHGNTHGRHQSYLDTTTPTSSQSKKTDDAAATFLQTPVPRRPSVQIDNPSSSITTTTTTVTTTTVPATVSATPASYNNTPPATPPLAQDPSKLITDVVAWCTARARIPTPDGSEYFLHIYENSKDKKEHLAFVFGDAIRSKSLDKVQWNETEMDRVKRGAYTGRLRNTVSEELQKGGAITAPLSTGSVETIAPMIPLARLHSECFTGEIGHSARCDCGEQLDEAIRLMKVEGSGVVVYLRQEGRGIGLAEKLKAYNLQDLGYDTVMANLMLNHGADERTYEVAQAILVDLGLNQIRLLTNNPDKIEQIEKGSQIKVVERVAMMPKSWEALELGMEAEFEVKEGAVENKIVKGKELDKYLKVKVERMRHLIPIPSNMTV
ncbi:GTP cyclohydrolase II [Modicella reniformis]|uniref:GTP cyclohydrolase II n=1 Tax=Modicella reniformis TaxID=1440133 RepID=A0A9P6SQC0_9FUNG|nr:GTP cyclohydrolase II [Modicella reniformis]